MIPKATILSFADSDSLLPSTVEKDYALGWLLYGIAQHPRLARWVFKGGTCLKKCFFETYRFSEDLDFTVPSEVELTEQSVRTDLAEVCEWVASASGIQFVADRAEVEQYTNKQGTTSFNAKVAYEGPLQMARKSLQRIKLDLTKHEIMVDPAELRPIFHRYDDRIAPSPSIACYSLNEILAEKTRALYERQGRARDVYDVVNLDRNFRDDIDPARSLEILRQKFAFKKLDPPTVAGVLARIDFANLATAWVQQLKQQLPVLPPVETFVSALPAALAWWMEPSPQTAARLEHSPISAGERAQPREHFVGTNRSGSFQRDDIVSAMDRIRFAARNRLLVQVQYDGVERIVEPYSLRFVPNTGNTNLFVHEVRRGGRISNQMKSLNVAKLRRATVLEEPFAARWLVEL